MPDGSIVVSSTSLLSPFDLIPLFAERLAAQARPAFGRRLERRVRPRTPWSLGTYVPRSPCFWPSRGAIQFWNERQPQAASC